MLDFVASGKSEVSDERAYYDGYYAAHSGWTGFDLDIASLGPRWHGPQAPPERRAAWRRLGDLRDKTVLLLGNGESYPELYLVTAHPALLIYSDLSPAGLRASATASTSTGTRTDSSSPRWTPATYRSSTRRSM